MLTLRALGSTVVSVAPVGSSNQEVNKHISQNVALLSFVNEIACDDETGWTNIHIFDAKNIKYLQSKSGKTKQKKHYINCICQKPESHRIL